MYTTLLFAEMKREYLMRVRYPIELLGGVLVIAMIYLFVGLTGALLGGDSVSFQEIVNPIENYRRFAAVTIWVLIMSGIGLLSNLVGEETESGTLEYFFLSRVHSSVSFLMRYVIGSFYSTVLVAVMLYTTYSLGPERGIPVHHLLALLACIELFLLGIGFAMCGATLRFKKLGAFVAIVYLAVFLAVIVAYSGRGFAIPFEFIPALGPVRALIYYPEGVTPGALSIMLLCASVVFAGGLAIYKGCTRASLRSGNLFLR